MTTITLDFETKSAIDIKKAGAARYAQDPTTHVMCLSYRAHGTDPVKSWAPWLGLRWLEELRDLAADPSVIFEAHNAFFEYCIWREHMRNRRGLPHIDIARFRCTMAACGYRALPLKLETVGKVLGLPQLKDASGHKAMLKLAGGHVYKSPVMQFMREQQTIDYCAQDIRAEDALRLEVGHLPAAEQRLQTLDQVINNRGVQLDVPLVRTCIGLAQEWIQRHLPRFRELTGCEPTQRAEFQTWLNDRGVHALPNLQAETVEGFLAEKARFDPEVVEAVEIRQLATRSSVAKYEAMNHEVCRDGRVRGLFQYHGATPGRWAARLFQFQNLPRPSGDHDLEVLAGYLATGNLDLVRSMYGDPMTALKDATRAMIIPTKGKLLTSADLSSIETHVLMVLAKDQDAVELLQKGIKLYIPMAEEIYARPIDKKKDLKEYTVGKAAILQLGYQAGGPGFHGSLGTYGVHDMTEEQCIDIVKSYRAKYPGVVALWKGLQNAAIEAVVNEGKECGYSEVVYHRAPGSRWLTCRLPNGRLLHYVNPSVRDTIMPWVDRNDQPVYRPTLFAWALRKGQWVQRSLYGGLLTENVVQAIARDFLVHGMWNCEAAGLPVVAHCHDEILSEHDPAFIDPINTMIQCMTDKPAWARHYPLGAEGWTAARYKK